MLLPLIITVAISLLPGATAQFSDTFNFSACSIKALGGTYTTAQVNISNGIIEVSFPSEVRLKVVLSSAVNVTSETKNGNQGPGSAYHQSIPGLTGTSRCLSTLKVFDSSKTEIFQLHFRTFGEQGALQSVPKGNQLNVTVLFNGEEVDQVSGQGPRIFTDISGCQHDGKYYFSDTSGCDSEGGFVTCSAESDLTVLPQTNTECVRDVNVCTVTASNLVSFDANYSVSVEDRCAYTLFSEPNVRVVGVFKERRRKDVMFLDHVIVHLMDSDSIVQLGPADRVKVNDTELNLNSPVETHGGVEFRKNDTGVTAVMSYAVNYTTSVFFNGNTAQVFMTYVWVLADSDYEDDANRGGLCANSSVTLNEAKSSDFSSDSCEMRYNEPADPSINCTAVTEHCQILNGTDFTDCHADIDPEPYFSSCNRTLCHYPDVDGLKCEFLEAYAHACSLKKNHTLESWRTDANCSDPLTFCQDTRCVDHEFCADGVNGGIGCFCRAIFASDQTLDVLPVCVENSASVTLVGCLLEERGVDYRQLHLNNDSCTGQVNESNHMVTFSFDSQDPCGVLVTANASHVLYENTLVNASGVPEPFQMDLSCFQTQPELMSMTFRMQANSVMQQMVSGSWNYTLNMTAYKDSAHRYMVQPNMAIQLNQSIFVEMMTEGLDGNLVSLVTNSCWATDGPSPDDGLRYDLISEGCSQSSRLVKVGINGQTTSSDFSFHMFHFVQSGNEIYLHCNVVLCPNQNGLCQPSCGGGSVPNKRRRRSARSAYVDENPALISMSWTI
ncbi:alpha-tectorin-like isoform X1 [Entelurus aequoreus]|uniref:alpha-tectorin-like isoform X1 n=1 Tax=Entelurus aequoreus TaxID=161455 RepID=UPI002B1E281A|nr:alpha-tectorin-like isoform X1 [Entelurus aequoreus]